MVRAWTCPARLCALVASLALIVLSFGIAAPATAVTPGLDRGNSEAAHENNADRKSESTSTTTTTTTSGGDDVAASKGSGKASGKSSASTKSSKSSKSDRGSTKSSSAKGGGSSKAGSHATLGTSGTSGDPTKPQPESPADKNDGGANAGTCHDPSATPGGAYCSTRDGTESGNGNDKGQAKGKPCAGCVGKADNKNPPGQAPNGANDGNNGYECDDNNGVGHGKDKQSAGNPAHTGCVTPTTSEDCPPETVAALGEDCEKDEPKCPDWKVDLYGADCEKDEPKCPDGSDLPCDKEDECIESAQNNFCGEGTPPTDEDEGPDAVIGGVQDFANPRPPTVAGVQQFAGAPQAGVLPSTGAASLTGALMTGGFALLLMGGVLIGLRRQTRAPAVR